MSSSYIKYIMNDKCKNKNTCCWYIIVLIGFLFTCNFIYSFSSSFFSIILCECILVFIYNTALAIVLALLYLVQNITFCFVSFKMYWSSYTMKIGMNYNYGKCHCFNYCLPWRPCIIYILIEKSLMLDGTMLHCRIVYCNSEYC